MTMMSGAQMLVRTLEDLGVDNLFGYTPKNYYWSSPMTTGRSYAVGLTLDIERMLE